MWTWSYIHSIFWYKNLTYDIELPPSGNKFGFNLLDDEYSTIPYATDTIPNSPVGCQLTTQYKKNMWVVAINGEDPITYQGAMDEINSHQTPHWESKFKIIICRSKSYQSTYLEDISSIFDQVWSVVSHLEVSLPEKKSPKEHFWSFKSSSETIMEGRFICEILQEPTFKPSFESYSNKISPWNNKGTPFIHCSKY